MADALGAALSAARLTRAGQGPFSHLIRLLLKFSSHLAKPLGDGAIGTHACKPQATLDLLTKISGI